MKFLTDILQGLTYNDVAGEINKSINELQFDSRKINEGDLFVAIPGTQVDGHKFIDIAVEKGATVVVGEYIPARLNPQVTYLEVSSSSKALGIMAANFYEHPSSQLKLVGVTGTNGKTSTVTLLHNLFKALQYKAGLLSTVENRVGNQVVTASHTTSDALTINRLLADMVAQGCEFAFMEVSSHAIHQHRIHGLDFAGGVFTNISHDHLDYHQTFKDYIFAKKAFFDEQGNKAFSLS
ncbi:MAG: Mur ligase family protein, partial [Bacteroidota bacterium]